MRVRKGRVVRSVVVVVEDVDVGGVGVVENLRGEGEVVGEKGVGKVW